MHSKCVREGCLLLFLLLVVASPVNAQSITPVPLPDPKIPGFTFPTPEKTIVSWTKTNNQFEINKHLWGIWTALTLDSGEVFQGRKLRVFETWQSPKDINSGVTLVPQHLEIPRQLTHGSDVLGNESILVTVKYDPTGAKHIIGNSLFSKKKLQMLLDDGAKKIKNFPVTAIALKPTYQPIAQKDLVDGRYYQLPAWPGPGTPLPGPARPFPPSDWKQCVWVDIQNQGKGDGSVDKVCDPDGRSRTPYNTYNLNSFINAPLTDIEARLANAQRLQQWEKAAIIAANKYQSLPEAANSLSEGDNNILVCMHVTSRETTRWTWQTFWWTPKPDAPHFPSSSSIAQQRPAQLKGAARNYAGSPAYSMVDPPQPNTGGKNVGNSVYAYNPWLETVFGPKTLRSSKPGTYDGRPVPNNVGIQSNCMSCHALARFPASTNLDYTGDRYVGLDSSEFHGVLQVDFLWSLPLNAQ